MGIERATVSALHVLRGLIVVIVSRIVNIGYEDTNLKIVDSDIRIVLLQQLLYKLQGELSHCFGSGHTADAANQLKYRPNALMYPIESLFICTVLWL